MTFVRFLFIAALFPWGALAQSTAKIDSFYSPSLGSMKAYTIILPDHYSPSHRYPVLYLLHGYSGGYRDWIDRTGILRYVSGSSFIVVMPDAGNSWYVNSFENLSDQYENYMIDDLPHHIRSLLSIDTTRQAIAGLSMGGYGALVLAFRHPGTFCFAGSLSGALSVPVDIPEWEHHAWGFSIAPNLKQTFGPRPGPFWNDHDLFQLFRRTPVARFPYCYIVTGEQDGFTNFLPAARALADSLRGIGARYEYHETPGSHNWKFWDSQIQPLLKRLDELFTAER